jgi:hypothetical protein
MRLEMALGKNPDFAQWYCDILGTLRPQIQLFGLWPEELGDLKTLQERLQAEVSASNTVVAWPGPVGAWCHKPKDEAPAMDR